MTMTQKTRTATSGGSTTRLYNSMGWCGLNSKPVVVASNSPIVNKWIYRYLEPFSGKGFRFYQANAEGDCVTLIQDIKPQFVFIEDYFFGKKTLGRLERIHKQFSKMRIVLFSVSAFPVERIAQYLQWSGGNYLSLRDSDKDIAAVLEAVFNKQKVLSPAAMKRHDRCGYWSDKEPVLTKKETAIVRCIVDGKTILKTAESLMISESTVYNHLNNVYEKFGTRNRVEVVKLAVSKGILPVEELMTYTVQS